MKKITLFLVPTAMAFMAAGCSVVELEPVQNEEPVQEEILIHKSFLAGTAETRTTLDGKKVLFSKGEAISIFDGSGNRMFTADEAGSNVSFSGEVSSTATEFYAMSPYSESTVFTKSGSTVSAKTTLPSVQEATPSSFEDGVNISAAKASSSDSFSLENVLSIAKFTLSSANLGGHQIASVEITSTYPLAGDVVVTYGETSSTAAGTNTVKKVALSHADGTVLADGTYYIALLPNAGGEISLKFTDSEGATAIKTATLKSAFEAGSIKNLGTVKGLTWENPKYYFMPVSEVSEGTYLIVSNNSGALLATKGVVPNAGNTYGYPKAEDVTSKLDNHGFIVLDDLTDAFEFANSNNGYTICQLSDEKFWYQYSNQYTSISISDDITNNSYYSITPNPDGTFKIQSKTVSKYLQYSTSYKTFGSYDTATGIVPTLYKLVEDISTIESVVTLTTQDAVGISSSSAVLTASYSDLFPVNPQNVGFYYGTSMTNLDQEVYVNTALSTSSGSFTASISSLAESTTYYYRATMMVWDPASNEYKEFLGEIKSFTTTEAATSTGWKGWLELPANTLTSDNIIYDEQWVESERNYTMSYDILNYAAMWVAYPLYSGTMGSTSRPGKWSWNGHFASDYQIDIRTNSYGVKWTESYGEELYARGHQIPNADRNINSSWQNQTFLVTNSTPQIQNRFNGTIWQKLEEAVRGAVQVNDTLYVVTGPVFRKQGGSESIKYINPQNDPDKSIPIANYYWKVILKVKRTDQVVTGAMAIGFWFEHKSYVNGETFDQGEGDGKTPFMCSVDTIEQWTGLDLFTNLPGDNDSGIEKEAESNASWKAFLNY